MKKIVAIVVAFLLPSAVFLHGASQCSKEGTTVVFVNGMNAISEDAIKMQRKILYDKYSSRFPFDTKITFDYAYNPSRGEGMDLLKSIMQSCAANNDVGDIDLIDMLNQLNGKVSTERVIFVGHSQGTLYTNAIYNRVNGKQLPTQSLGVINIATPAHYLPGGGTYLTSSNDTVINAARSAQASCAQQALAANTTLPYTDADPEGHDFIQVYLEHASAQITRSIHDTAQRLSVDTLTRAKCIDPEIAISWEKTKRLALGAGAPFVNGTYYNVKAASYGVQVTGQTLYAVSNTMLDMSAYAGARGADQLMALGRTVIQGTSYIITTTQQLASVLYGSRVQPAQQGTAILAVTPPAVESPSYDEPISFEELPVFEQELAEEQPAALVPPLPVLPEDEIILIPINDPTYTVHRVVSTSQTGTSNGGVEVTPSPQSSPVFTLAGGAGQGGGGGAPAAPIPEPTPSPTSSASTPPPLTCTAPQVLSSDGTACIDPTPTCTPPHALNAAGNACELRCTTPEIPNTEGTACITPDTTPPTLTVALTGCLNDASSSLSCLTTPSAVVTATLTPEAGAVLTKNTLTTEELTHTITETTTFTLTDAAGNTTTKTVTRNDQTNPLIISEVGFNARGLATHQYVELYNTTAESLLVDGLSLRGTPEIVALTGTIAPSSYFLITNGFDMTPTPDMQSTWSSTIATSGETLTLQQDAVILDTFTMKQGSSPYFAALERSRKDYAVYAPSYTTSINDFTTAIPHRGDSLAFYGTPKQRNSIDYVLTTLAGTYTKEYSPYLLLNPGLMVFPGTSATFESGTTIMMGPGFGNSAPRVEVHGTLSFNGTAAEPVSIIPYANGFFDTLAVYSGGTLQGTYTHITNGGRYNLFSDGPGMIENRGGTISFTNSSFTNTALQTFYLHGGMTTLTGITITNPFWTSDSIIRTNY
ncbi:MAG: hypothetical protein RI911_99, partial [Candidatus Parcubacteria bacterium]